MNVIDLTQEENNLSEPSSPCPITMAQVLPNLSQDNKTSNPFKPEPKLIIQYEWISVNEDSQEVDYVKTFQDKHKNDNIDFKSLNLERLDPKYTEPSSYGINVIEKIQKALSKDGILKAIKKAQDGYDMDDTFVDDSENSEQ